MFFSDGVSGKVIAWGNLPPGFSAYSAVVDTVQSYGRPYTAVTELTGSPTGRSLFFDSGECFHQIKFGQGERHSEGAYDDRTMMPVKSGVEALCELREKGVQLILNQNSGQQSVITPSTSCLPVMTFRLLHSNSAKKRILSPIL